MPSDYYTPREVIYKNNKSRNIPYENYSHAVSNHGGVITNKTKNGTYNIVEKDFGDHKVIYHIPVEYGENYDVSQLDDIPITEEQLARNSPKLVRRRIIQQYDDFDYDDDYEYVEEVPVLSPRRRIYYSPRRQQDTQVVQRVYETRSPTQTVEYIYEDDPSDVYDYRRDNDEEVEYIVRERAPKQIYTEEPRPTRRTIYVQDPSVPVSPPRPPPVSYSPRRSPSYEPSPRSNVNQRSPSPVPTKPVRRNNISPSLPSTRKQQTTRSPIHEPPIRPNIPKTTEPPLRLMDVIARNRAKRGSRIPKPRREIDEERVYDPPTYQRNIIKNGFIVHK